MLGPTSHTAAADTAWITAMGMVSSLGRDAATACAAARAGLIRPTELKCLSFQTRAEFGTETLDGIPPVVGYTVPGIAAGFMGSARAALLASAALEDLLTNRKVGAGELTRMGIHLAVSDSFIPDVAALGGAPTAQGSKQENARSAESAALPSARWKEDASLLVGKVLSRCRLSILPEHHAVYANGRAGFVQAVNDAIVKLQNGVLEHCLVGAVDCCVEPAFLEAAAVVGVLKTGDNPSGFIPGEAAGFLLLQMAASAGDAAKATIARAAFRRDERHQFSEDPPLGQALALAVRDVLGNAPDEAVGRSPAWVIGDLNGTERRALDWGHALVRLRRDRPLAGLPLWLPAASFGETGAAAGVVAVCMALRAFARGYAPGGQALIWLAADDGFRGVMLVQNARLSIT